ncbi:Uncharacterised protein [BD1-7 clade bacterium]|uniref:Polyketide cyclase / dehydrase and lipid transport n=1 Tax=BD1-7 clade bacterium TaxID=2029982 RepID=A0A5S9PJT1_9GAMM|nr:Uncharacterised protein [BD1-7 clade bacterium]CAA0104412.1 Uncharacterised protein [BD1-7 clade bacterium]
MLHHVESVIQINATANRVWCILDDFGGLDKFSVGVQKSLIVGNKETGIGAVRYCMFNDGSSLHEEIVEYEPHKHFRLVLSEFTLPMESVSASFRVEPLSETTCEVKMEMDFVMKLGLLGRLMGVVLIRPLMKSVHKKLLRGLAYHALTGEKISDKLPPREDLVRAIALLP